MKIFTSVIASYLLTTSIVAAETPATFQWFVDVQESGKAFRYPIIDPHPDRMARINSLVNGSGGYSCILTETSYKNEFTIKGILCAKSVTDTNPLIMAAVCSKAEPFYVSKFITVGNKQLAIGCRISTH